MRNIMKSTLKNIAKMSVLTLPLVMMMPQSASAAGAGPSRGSVSSTKANGKRTPAPVTKVQVVNPRSSISSMNTNGRKGGPRTRPSGRTKIAKAGTSKPRPKSIGRRPGQEAATAQAEMTRATRAVHFAGSNKVKIDKAVQTFLTNTANPTSAAVSAMRDGRAPLGFGLVNSNNPNAIREAVQATERRKRANGTIRPSRWTRFKEFVSGKKG